MPRMRTQTIVTAPIRIVPRDWIVRRYGEAHDRFRAAWQQPDLPEVLFIPLFEALNWTALLEEAQRPHTDQLLQAIRFARNNALVHDWADAVEGRNVPHPHCVLHGMEVEEGRLPDGLQCLRDALRIESGDL
jgi:hypothetical protein